MLRSDYPRRAANNAMSLLGRLLLRLALLRLRIAISTPPPIPARNGAHRLISRRRCGRNGGAATSRAARSLPGEGAAATLTLARIFGGRPPRLPPASFCSPPLAKPSLLASGSERRTLARTRSSALTPCGKGWRGVALAPALWRQALRAKQASAAFTGSHRHGACASAGVSEGKSPAWRLHRSVPSPPAVLEYSRDRQHSLLFRLAFSPAVGEGGAYRVPAWAERRKTSAGGAATAGRPEHSDKRAAPLICAGGTPGERMMPRRRHMVVGCGGRANGRGREGGNRAPLKSERRI